MQEFPFDMNEIKEIENQINVVAQMLQQAEALLVADPTNFSHQVNIDTLKGQVSELERKLQFVKAKRNKEVIEIRLIGKTANGT